ncbi:MAG TPA: SDR family oxidoreductase [Polyangiaceae bacterium]|nr:SDR family oxidoreductase [Polyangiaceae bacterium]
MQLESKVAIVYGGGGVIGGAAALAFAREGAKVHLAGPTRSKLARVAKAIEDNGGRASVAVVDALDRGAVEGHVAAVLDESGRLDIALNAVGIVHVQGTPFPELSLADFEHPIHSYMRTLFVTAQAACRPMMAQRSGVFLSLSTPGAKMAFPGVTGFGAACAAIEGFARHLAMDLGAHGVRVVCLRPDALPDAVALGSHSRKVFEPYARKAGVSVEEMLAGPSPSPLKRAPRVDEVAAAAAFAASNGAGAMTGTVMNLTCGLALD